MTIVIMFISFTDITKHCRNLHRVKLQRASLGRIWFVTEITAKLGYDKVTTKKNNFFARFLAPNVYYKVFRITHWHSYDE